MTYPLHRAASPSVLPDAPSAANFEGREVLALDARRTDAYQTLIRQFGGVPRVVPVMREQKPDLGGLLAGLERDLRAGDVHALVCPTVTGARVFLRELSAHAPHLLGALAGVRLRAGNAGVQEALSEAGLAAELLPGLHGADGLCETLPHALTRGQHAVILEYGEALPVSALRELGYAGLRATSLPMYRCAFPTPSAPLAQAVRDCILGGPDVVLLSSGLQALHFLKYAERLGLLPEARAALGRLVVVSIGPACSEAAADLGLHVSAEASPHKLEALVASAAAHFGPPQPQPQAARWRRAG